MIVLSGPFLPSFCSFPRFTFSHLSKLWWPVLRWGFHDTLQQLFFQGAVLDILHMISQSQECSERWLLSKPHVKYFSKELMDTASAYCIYCPRLFSELSVSSHSLRSLSLPLTSRFRSLISLSWVGRSQHLLFILFYANKDLYRHTTKLKLTRHRYVKVSYQRV